MTILPRVTTAAESAAADSAAMAGGVPSRALMQRAGAAAAAEIARRYADRMRGGVLIYSGPGNNGGDGWVVARALATAGVPVRVQAVGDARTDDSRAARALAESVLDANVPSGHALVVDALLGTGSSGAPRGEIAASIAEINAKGAAGDIVVAVDIPSGLDSDSGASEHAVHAHHTITFGTIKRGLLMARDVAGEITLVDIGLPRASSSTEPQLVTQGWVRERVQPFAADVHKGTRKKLAIVGGQLGMAGAAMLAGRAALRTGIGMVRLVVAPEAMRVVQSGLLEALARPWPGEHEMRDTIVDWADVLLIGPGLGASPSTRAFVDQLLTAWRGPVVLDADALNVFAGEAPSLGKLLRGRPALVTPHPAEFARLFGGNIDRVLANRFDIGTDAASSIGAAVLLKGVPTVVTGETGARLVSAAGTPALATAGSGDLLSGVAATLLAHTGDALVAGGAAAWAHGHAAELASAHGARGVTLVDVEARLGQVWQEPVAHPVYPVLAELPAIGRGA